MENKTTNYRIPLKGRPLNYADRENWMFFGDNDDVDHTVDVIFFYPTSVSPECDGGVCDSLSYLYTNSKRSYLQSAETLAEYSNMYVPYYRQISFQGIIKTPTPDGLQKAVMENVPRTDAYAALDYYFAHCNKGKPYILAGHSQGSTVLKIILSEYMKIHPEYMDRMIACYATGFYFPDSWFEENPHVKKAKGECDTGCLITWNTVGEGVKVHSMVVAEGGAYCINPLNWKTDDTYADIALNKGSCKVDAKTLEKTQVEGLADARIDLTWGELITTTYHEFIPKNKLFGDRCCHFEDWALFTQNIKENARKRIEAYFAEKQSKEG